MGVALSRETPYSWPSPPAPSGDADRHGGRVPQVDAVGVDEIVRELHRAADVDGVQGPLRVIAAALPGSVRATSK
jgi:hypothetical protein